MKADIKREEMLDAFMQAFIEFGLDKSSTKKLTSKAGVNEALLYYYFADKNEAIVACVNRQYEKNRMGSLEIIKKTINDPEKLMDKLFNYTKKTSAEQRFMMEVIAHPVYSKNILPVVKEMNKKLETELIEYAEQNGKNASEFVTIIQLAYSALNDYCLTKNEETLMASKQFIVKQLQRVLA
ncbi:MAG: TetR/AcrR family transcriptional regulator [Proteocatella sp.]